VLARAERHERVALARVVRVHDFAELLKLSLNILGGRGLGDTINEKTTSIIS